MGSGLRNSSQSDRVQAEKEKGPPGPSAGLERHRGWGEELKSLGGTLHCQDKLSCWAVNLEVLDGH